MHTSEERRLVLRTVRRVGLAWCTGKGFNGVSGCGKVQGKAAGPRSGVVTGPSSAWRRLGTLRIGQLAASSSGLVVGASALVLLERCTLWALLLP